MKAFWIELGGVVIFATAAYGAVIAVGFHILDSAYERGILAGRELQRMDTRLDQSTFCWSGPNQINNCIRGAECSTGFLKEAMQFECPTSEALEKCQLDVKQEASAANKWAADAAIVSRALQVCVDAKDTAELKADRLHDGLIHCWGGP